MGETRTGLHYPDAADDEADLERRRTRPCPGCGHMDDAHHSGRPTTILHCDRCPDGICYVWTPDGREVGPGVLPWPAQEWLEHMADAWIANPQVTPSFPPGLHIREAGRRIKLDPVKLTEATAYERVEPPDGVEFYAILADGTEITAKRSFGAYGQP